MNSIITVKPLNQLNNISTNIKDQLFNLVNSHIIKDYHNQNNNINLNQTNTINFNILYDNQYFYYIINLNNHIYNGKLKSNEININIQNNF